MPNCKFILSTTKITSIASLSSMIKKTASLKTMTTALFSSAKGLSRQFVNWAGAPTSFIAMNDVGAPAQFTNCLDNPFAEENSAVVIVFKEAVFFIMEDRLAMEVIFVVDKINLQFGIRY